MKLENNKNLKKKKKKEKKTIIYLFMKSLLDSKAVSSRVVVEGNIEMTLRQVSEELESCILKWEAQSDVKNLNFMSVTVIDHSGRSVPGLFCSKN